MKAPPRPGCSPAPARMAALILVLAVSCAPEVDVEKLYAQFRSGDYEEKTEAGQRLSQLVSEGKTDVFARGLRSENAETRVQSILHLMLIENDEARKALVGELELSRRFSVFYNPIRLVPVSTPSDSRIMIARIVFLKGGDPKAVEILAGTYGKEPDAEARLGTVYALGALASPETTPALRRALRDPDLRVVRAALEGLSLTGAPGVTDTLIEGLTDSDELVRLNTATVLAGFPGRNIAGALMELVRKDPSRKVRLAAMGSAAFAGGPAVFEPILAVLQSRDSSAEMKGASASALKSITNQDFGQDADRWARWYEQSRRKPPSP